MPRVTRPMQVLPSNLVAEIPDHQNPPRSDAAHPTPAASDLVRDIPHHGYPPHRDVTSPMPALPSDLVRDIPHHGYPPRSDVTPPVPSLPRDLVRLIPPHGHYTPPVPSLPSDAVRPVPPYGHYTPPNAAAAAASPPIPLPSDLVRGIPHHQYPPRGDHVYLGDPLPSGDAFLGGPVLSNADFLLHYQNPDYDTTGRRGRGGQQIPVSDALVADAAPDIPMATATSTSTPRLDLPSNYKYPAMGLGLVFLTCMMAFYVAKLYRMYRRGRPSTTVAERFTLLPLKEGDDSDLERGVSAAGPITYSSFASYGLAPPKRDINPQPPRRVVVDDDDFEACVCFGCQTETRALCELRLDQDM